MMASQCTNKACVNLKCQSPANTGVCTSDIDASDGYYCKNSQITAQTPMGGACTGGYTLECYHGACNKATLKCDTFYNAVTVQNLNSLIGGGADGFKPCTIATQSTDCTYQTSAGVQSGTALGYTCVATSMAPTMAYYCVLVGGESIFLNVAKAVNTF